MIAVVAIGGVSVRAQDGGPAVTLPAPGAPCVAIGCLYEHVDADGAWLAPDIARALAAVRCARAQAAAPQLAVSVHVDDEVTAVAAAGKRADASALAGVAAAFPSVPGGDDERARAIAAAALARV
ncbi:MAG: hypothetical protein ACK6D2_11180, partial [Planctomycetota bacterium]